MLVTILHEAAHHIGHASHYAAELAARSCLREEEEEEDDPGGGEETPQVTCTESTVWVEPETEEVWVPPSGGTTGPGTVNPGPDGVTAVPIEGITVSVAGGYWATVTIQEGYWLTTRECLT